MRQIILGLWQQIRLDYHREFFTFVRHRCRTSRIPSNACELIRKITHEYKRALKNEENGRRNQFILGQELRLAKSHDSYALRDDNCPRYTHTVC